MATLGTPRSASNTPQEHVDDHNELHARHNASSKLIEKITLASDAATVTFSAIPQTYNHLVLYAMARVTSAQAGPYSLRVQFNGDTAANYDSTILRVTNNTTQGITGAGVTSIPIGLVATDSASAGRAASNKAEILNYASTTWHKHTVGFTAHYEAAAIAGYYQDTRSGLWRSAAAITSITVLTDATGSFKTGSLFTLYGME